MNATLTQVEDGGDVLSLALLTVVGVRGLAVAFDVSQPSSVPSDRWYAGERERFRSVHLEAQRAGCRTGIQDVDGPADDTGCR